MFSYDCQAAEPELLPTESRPSKIRKKKIPEYDKVTNAFLKYPAHFYDQKEGILTIDDTPASISVQGKDIAKWTIEDKDQVQEVNLSTTEKPHNVRICKNLELEFKEELVKLLQEFKDVFA
jgi:hypothetical protein